MSYTIDLASHGKELKQAYDAVISSDPSVNWAVFNYDAGQSSALKLATEGGGPLSDFVEEFDDGKVQYGFAKIDYNNIPKYVLVGWVGEGVPERTKGYFNAHYATVAKYFRGYHVQITARSSDDLSESIILQKVHDASGSKYSSPAGSGTVPLRPKTKPAFAASSSIPDDEWGDGGASIQTEFQKVPSSYKPTKVEVGASKAGTRPEPVKPSHEPVGKVDIAALRASGKDSKFADSRPTPVQSSYQPVGKVDIAAIRAQAKANPNYKSTFESQPIESAGPTSAPAPAAAPAAAPAPTPSSNDDEEEGPKLSVKDRMKAFGGAAPSANYYSPPPPVNSQDKDEDDTPKSFAERKNAFANNATASQPTTTATATVSLDSGRLTSLPKPKVANTVSGRYGAAAAGRGTAPAMPSDPLTAGPKAAAGFKDFASEGGKTPAQLWAEKHGKAAPAPSADPEPVNRQPSPEPVNREPSPEPEPEIEKPDMSSLRDKFSHASVEDSTPQAPPAPPAREESASSSFSDITSRFAQQNSTPPPLPSASRPVPSAPEPEPEPQPVPEPETHFEIANPVPRQPEPEPEPVHEPEPEPVPQAQPHAEEEPPAVGGGAAATALYDYEKDEDNEIQLVEGELVTDIDFVDTEWWAGKNQKGEYGLFPAAYVELKGDNAPVAAAVDQAPPSPEPQQAAAAAPAPAPADSGPSAVAEYDYEAAEEGELTFPEGAIITDIDFVDENWWSGVYNGERNLFPANYVTLQN